MNRSARRLIAAIAIAAAGLAFGPAASASRLPSRAAAEAALQAVAASKSAAVAHAEVQRARRALERADGARASGDAFHAEMLEAQAREWAETARDLVRAAEAEAEAEKIERAWADLDTKLVRARALLEETVARLGRTREQVRQLEAGTAVAGSAAPAASGTPPASKAPPKAPPKPKPAPAPKKGGAP